TSHIHDSFVPAAEPPKVPENQDDWARLRDSWMNALKEKCFAGWPQEPGPLNLKKVHSAERDGVVREHYEFDSQPGVRLQLFVTRDARAPKVETLSLRLQMPSAGSHPSDDVAAAEDVNPAVNRQGDETTAASASFFPRGIGPTAWSGSEKKQVQIRRRFMLLGQTVASMQVWDVRRALQALRSIDAYRQSRIELEADRDLAALALYASLFEPQPIRLSLADLPKTHQAGPDFLNVMRYLDIPQAVAMAVERGDVLLTKSNADGWEFPAAAAQQLKWSTGLTFRQRTSDQPQTERGGDK
ncbi:MAG TPA: hypothetical protein VHB99_09530, partial [Pirellulales bacterium]|nr:hypothetical protein [Pirellulales bacterium]